MKASDLLVQCLENEGVEHVFGVPGEETLDILESLARSRIQFIMTRHEQGAAFMADAYGRLTGKAGVCLATLGPGATNLTTGIADADLDFAPLVAITGQANLDRVHKESHQYVDVGHIFQAVTKWTVRVTRPEVIPEIVSKAFKLAETERRGAVHIEVTQDIAGQSTHGEPLQVQRPRRASPDRIALEQAAKLIGEARFPVILAGGRSGRQREAALELQRFARQFKIPVTHTFMGKGTMPDDDPLALLPLGLPGGGDLCTSGMCHADLVIAVGYDQVEYAPQRWNSGEDKRIIHIDHIPTEVDQYYNPEVEIVADIRETLGLLGEAVHYGLREDEASCLERLQQLDQRERIAGWESESSPLTPQKLIAGLRASLGREDMLISDVGAHKMWLARLFPTYEPNTVLISNGLAAMGFGLPAAITAKLVHPERRVIAACGDGGFMMTCAELETAVRLALPLVVVLWIDGGHGLIRWKQELEGRPTVGVDFGNPDFVKLAHAFGAVGYQANTAAELENALNEAFQATQPSIVAVPVDYRENVKLSHRLSRMGCPLPHPCGR